MKFKADENLPVEAAAILCASGFDAKTVWDENRSGYVQRVVAAIGRRSPVGELWIIEDARIRFRLSI